MNDICKNCGAPVGLHHFETNQCPLGGIEAPIGREQLWMSTTFLEEENNRMSNKFATNVFLEELHDTVGTMNAARLESHAQSILDEYSPRYPETLISFINTLATCSIAVSLERIAASLEKLNKEGLYVDNGVAL